MVQNVAFHTWLMNSVQSKVWMDEKLWI